MAKHNIPLSARFHFWKGTTNRLNIHINLFINKGDAISVGGHNIRVIKTSPVQKSSYYPPLNYYEIQFEHITN